MSNFPFKLFIPFFFAICFLPVTASAVTRTLYLGLSGDDVASAQNQLISKGYLASEKNSGYFGALTESAVKKFQCEQKIVCSGSKISGYGIIGPKTMAALGIKGSRAFEISGWIPYWRIATGTADVLPHLSQLSSVIPFGFTMKNNGTLSDTAELTKEPWLSFFKEARRQNVLVVPTVMWGNGETIHKILSDSKSRIALEDEIANAVKSNNFDGIDIDFEAKKHETINYFSTFLRGLDLRMGNKLIYCTVEARMPIEDRYLPGDTIPPDALDYANDYVEMNKYCDRIEIMAYDQGTVSKKLNKARSAPYAPVADPDWVESLITLASKTIPKNKIILGIASYGYEYTVTPIPGDGYQYKRLWAFNPKYAIEIATKLGITPTRTSANEMGFTYDSRISEPAPSVESSQVQQIASATTTTAENSGSTAKNNQPFNFLTWSDSTAIAEKVALARRLGIRGVAVFKFDGGEDPKMWEVLK
ncbi:MAG: glycosyl hydrolase family 18 protein [Patescibacteria group bacterium]